MLRTFRSIMVDERGVSLAEYALLLGLIAAVCVAAVTLLGTNISSGLNDFAGKV